MKYLSEKDIDEFFSKDSDSQSEEYFTCINCKKEVSLSAPGTKNRNHCPFCLYSIHVDKNVGDRLSDCLGKMKAVGRFQRPNKEDVIVHQCEKCQRFSNNRIAGDDDYELFLKLPIIQN